MAIDSFPGSEHLLLASEWAQFSVCVFIIIIVGLLVKRLTQPNEEPPGVPLRRDFTLAELREYDGKHIGADGQQRILVALNGKVYDVSSERDHYMPGGRYASYAGRDCTRHLATYDLNPINSNEYYVYGDLLSCVSEMERESIQEWEIVFKKKYDLVGKLVPVSYSAKGCHIPSPHVTVSPASVVSRAHAWEPRNLHESDPERERHPNNDSYGMMFQKFTQQQQQQQQQQEHTQQQQQQYQQQQQQEQTKQPKQPKQLLKSQLTDMTAKGLKQQQRKASIYNSKDVAIDFDFELELQQQQQQQQGEQQRQQRDESSTER